MKTVLLSSALLATAMFATPVVAADAAAGKAKSAACAACHGADGISMVPNYPNLKGQKEAYLVKAITDFRDGKRSDPTMNAMVGSLTDADIANLAAYYSGL